jgi:SAM-dependent methyltransferase
MIQLDSTLKATVDELVAQPYQKQKNNHVWQQKVLAKDDNHQRKIVLQQGKADFINGESGLSPDQTVLLYCRHYLQMHLASSRYVLDACSQKMFGGDLPFLREESLMLDFGCGPLTTALALASYSQQVNKQTLKLNYIGVDHAPAMLKKAEEFSQNYNLFKQDSQFKFLTDYRKLDFLLYSLNKRNFHTKKSWIILNFSYFFASSSLNAQELAIFVNKLLKQYSDEHFLILFQNPPIAFLNQKWIQFKNSLEFTFSEISDQVKVSYQEYPIHLDIKIDQPKPPINLYYEILSK